MIATEQPGVCFFAGQHDGLLLGDSGYPCRAFLMTPYLETHDDAQARYNRAHCRTRVVIEQSFGILKRRFPCLHYGLRNHPERCCSIILACFILHNVAMQRDEADVPVIEPIAPDDNIVVHPDERDDGRAVRNRITYNFFNH